MLFSLITIKIRGKPNSSWIDSRPLAQVNNCPVFYSPIEHIQKVIVQIDHGEDASLSNRGEKLFPVARPTFQAISSRTVGVGCPPSILRPGFRIDTRDVAGVPTTAPCRTSS